MYRRKMGRVRFPHEGKTSGNRYFGTFNKFQKYLFFGTFSEDLSSKNMKEQKLRVQTLVDWDDVFLRIMSLLFDV